MAESSERIVAARITSQIEERGAPEKPDSITGGHHRQSRTVRRRKGSFTLLMA
jgi:hypothetical protein